MTSTKDKWKTFGVSNPHNLVSLYATETGNVGVFLHKSTNDGSRLMTGVPHGYQVIRPGFKTDPEGPWTNHGHKTFYAGRDWGQAFQEAVAWATERFNLSGEFVPITGFGTARFPVEVATWAKNKIKEVKDA
jgi:hypothetical protein